MPASLGATWSHLLLLVWHLNETASWGPPCLSTLDEYTRLRSRDWCGFPGQRQY